MELFDLSLKSVKSVVVDDDVVGTSQSFLPRHLRVQDGLRFLAAAAIARHDAGNLNVFGYINDKDPLNDSAEFALKQERSDQNGIGAADSGQALLEMVSDEGVQYRLESPPIIGRREDALPQRTPVQLSCRRQHLGPERLDDRAQAATAGPHYFSCGHIGVDQGDAALAEHVGDRSLAAGDSASKSNDEHRVRLLLVRKSESAEVRRLSACLPGVRGR